MLPDELRLQILDMIQEMAKCQSFPYTKKATIRTHFASEDTYNPLIGDPCYKFSRKAMKNFFRNIPCSILFLFAVPYIQEHLPYIKG